MRQKLITAIWYHLRIYMNFPNSLVEAEDALEDHLGKGSRDLEVIIGKLNSYLNELGIQENFEILPHMTLSQLLNQINDLQNGKV